MKRIRAKFLRLWRAEAGASLAEYGLLVLLVSVAAIGAVNLFGSKAGNLYDRIAAKVTAVLG